MKLKTQFEFDAAHRLVGYEGKCSNLHGHIWKVEIEIEGKGVDDIGILWDFTNTKLLKDRFDHKTILMKCPENDKLMNSLYDITPYGVYVMDCNPTAENLCSEILYILQQNDKFKKYKVTVWESPKSSCEVEG